ncbi:MAG: hypothetical protein H3C32_14565 [Anaerolineae bacterium]|nr:MAG: hypothetical protein UZ13_02608 [Chloroflexi bacterium OLB13]MBW7880524.1 hypothetical protein [Anaerolineae bacterium]
MARRRRRTQSYNAQGSYPRRKSQAEARAEHITWALLIVVFAILSLLPDGLELPNWTTPFAGAAILFGSGIYQYTRRWRVSPIVWVGGALMAATVFYGVQINPARDLIGFSLLVFAAVIAFGVFTGEG